MVRIIVVNSGADSILYSLIRQSALSDKLTDIKTYVTTVGKKLKTAANETWKPTNWPP